MKKFALVCIALIATAPCAQAGSPKFNQEKPAAIPKARHVARAAAPTDHAAGNAQAEVGDRKQLEQPRSAIREIDLQPSADNVASIREIAPFRAKPGAGATQLPADRQALHTDRDQMRDGRSSNAVQIIRAGADRTRPIPPEAPAPAATAPAPSGQPAGAPPAPAGSNMAK